MHFRFHLGDCTRLDEGVLHGTYLLVVQLPAYEVQYRLLLGRSEGPCPGKQRRGLRFPEVVAASDRSFVLPPVPNLTAAQEALVG